MKFYSVVVIVSMLDCVSYAQQVKLDNDLTKLIIKHNAVDIVNSSTNNNKDTNQQTDESLIISFTKAKITTSHNKAMIEEYNDSHDF